jgi:hypothetical protein
MDDATDANKVVAAIFAAGMCATKESKHEHYLTEYESFLSLLETRDAQARKAADPGLSFTQIGGRDNGSVKSQRLALVHDGLTKPAVD